MFTRTVLVIDADRDTRDVIRAILEHHSYRVLEAEEAEEGYRLAREQKPDLIIGDYPLRVADGTALSTRLRQDPETVGIPQFIVTARILPDGERSAAQEVARLFRMKPFTPREALEETERLFGPGAEV